MGKDIVLILRRIKLKYLVYFTVFVYSVACISIIFLLKIDKSDFLEPVEMNDIIYTIRNEWPNVTTGVQLLKEYDIDYIIFDSVGNQVGATNSKLKYHKMGEIHYGFSADIIKNNKNVGKIIFIESSVDKNLVVQILCLIVLFFSFLVNVFIFLYVYKYIMRPVKKISLFSKQIANGNLDVSISNFDSVFFGTLSESYDILREELIFSKKKEREADKNRREVIASISHDIKNPIASIQAIAEYQFFTLENDEQKKEYQKIIEKTNQISGLISNLHTSMLDDLESLSVKPEMEESRLISTILKQSDYRGLIKSFCIQECLIMLDKVRFQQVIDNIISNSYKYANTLIHVKSYYKGNYLCISIRDFGSGVLKEEEIFLTQKYFRGKNAKDKEGSGIGLYITEYLLKGMQGKMEFFTKENEGLEIKIYLALVL